MRKEGLNSGDVLEGTNSNCNPMKRQPIRTAHKTGDKSTKEANPRYNIHSQPGLGALYSFK
jgi:hypothetical protein